MKDPRSSWMTTEQFEAALERHEHEARLAAGDGGFTGPDMSDDGWATDRPPRLHPGDGRPPLVGWRDEHGIFHEGTPR